MGRRSLAFAWFLLTESAAAETSECPCLRNYTLWDIDPPVTGTVLGAEAGPHDHDVAITYAVPSHIAIDPSARLANGILQRLPADYGFGGCRAYDQGLLPYCAPGASASFCNVPWCKHRRGRREPACSMLGRRVRTVVCGPPRTALTGQRRDRSPQVL